MGIVDELLRGREAFERRDWAQAVDHLSAVVPDRSDPDDLGALAIAEYLVGDDDASVRAWQGAFRLHIERGETVAAVRDAFWIGLVLNSTGKSTVGSGWVARATRLLEDHGDDVVERGYLMIHALYRHLHQGEFEAALQLAAEITDLGRRWGDQGLVAHGLCSQGRLLMFSGRVPDGLAHLDEAMVSVTTGELSPILAGMVYCTMIEGCQSVGDVGRMAEWTDALNRWCDAQPELVRFTGQCAVHRAQIMRSRGAYDLALEELALALVRYEASGLDPAAGLALYERGEVLRLRGEYDAATVAYDAAAAYGREPQPGLALLWAAKGRTAAAARVIRRLLTDGRDPVSHSQLLPAAAEILLSAGDVEAAREVVDELERTALAYGCTALSARAAFARGAVEMADPEPGEALAALRRAAALWLELGATYDVARSRFLVGRLLRELGDEESATDELTAARRTFEELGALPARDQVDQLLQVAFPDGLTAREVEVLRLVAAGHGNQQIAATLTLSEKTVARHLSNIFVKIDVTSRTAAAAYAFQHRLAAAG